MQTTTVAKEMVKRAPKEWGGKINLGPPDWERFIAFSPIVQNERARRRHPREISATELVTPEVHAVYAELWRAEARALKEHEALEASYTWRAIFRRLIDRLGLGQR